MGAGASTHQHRTPKGGRLVKQAPLTRIRSDDNAEMSRPHKMGTRMPPSKSAIKGLTKTVQAKRRVAYSPPGSGGGRDRMSKTTSGGSAMLRGSSRHDSVKSNGSNGGGNINNLNLTTTTIPPSATSSKKHLPGIAERTAEVDARRQREQEKRLAANKAQARAAEQRRQAKQKGALTFTTRPSPKPPRKYISLTNSSPLDEIQPGKRSRSTSPKKKADHAACSDHSGVSDTRQAAMASNSTDGGNAALSSSSSSLPPASSSPPSSTRTPTPLEWGAAQIDANGAVSAEVELGEKEQ